jgi:palmitoyl transferase
MLPRQNISLFSTTIRLSALVIFLAALTMPALADGNPAGSTAPAVAVSSSTTESTGRQSTWYGTGWKHIEDIFGKGGFELYAPVYTLHMPYAYTRALLRSYNDIPLGGGLGIGRFNESGNWEGVYAMEFSDSHRKPEYEGGYGWIPTWHPFSNNLRIGAGLTAFITARSDIAHYTPFPAVLPLGSVGYRDFDIQCTFIPGGKNDGNVLFTWVKLSFY